MKIKYYLIICSLLFTVANGIQGQSVDDFLNSIERNNTTLKALREQIGADKLENRTGLTPPNPEVSVEYLWGKPTETGNQFDYNITQSFDFPTAYFQRGNLADLKNKQLDLTYEEQRREIRHEARLAYFNLIYMSKKKELVEGKLEKILRLDTAYAKMLNNKSATVLQTNKIFLNKMLAEKAMQFLEADITIAKADLERLNGGPLPAQALYPYPKFKMPDDFDNWYAQLKTKNIALISAQKSVEISKKEEKLRLSENLPKLSAGFYSEHILGSRLQGFQAGVSIPLWEGKNKIKQQKATTRALQAQHEDAELRFKNSMKSFYDKALQLGTILTQTQEILGSNRNQEILEKNLTLGEYSLFEYLSELIDYYDIMENLQDVEYEYNISVAELQKWE